MRRCRSCSRSLWRAGPCTDPIGRARGSMSRYPSRPCPRVPGPGFGVSGFGLRVSILRYRISKSGSRLSAFGLHFSGVGCRAPGFAFRIRGLRFRFSCLESRARFRISGFKFRLSAVTVWIPNFCFRVSGFGLRGSDRPCEVKLQRASRGNHEVLRRRCEAWNFGRSSYLRRCGDFSCAI